jgi:hypothetical protein
MWLDFLRLAGDLKLGKYRSLGCLAIQNALQSERF